MVRLLAVWVTKKPSGDCINVYFHYLCTPIMKRIFGVLLVVLMFLAGGQGAGALSLNLDSIAEWGKFPRFLVNTYRWGDKFFNGYDTTYVVGTGYKFNGKTTTSIWTDGYRFVLPNDKYIFMVSDPSTSVGVYLTYLALSAGYDVNVSKLLGSRAASRKRWRFGFNCMLFAAELSYIRNNGGTRIRRFGDRHKPMHYDLPFYGIDNQMWSIDAYYFFNHKRYSEAASFSFSRIQKKSQGSFYLGFSYYHQKLSFDFRGLPHELIAQLPASWNNYRFGTNTTNYALRIGYGYNWVFHPRWVLGVSESPVIGVSKGFINSDIERVTFSMFNRLKLSVVWNCGRWFAGASAKFDLSIVNDQKTTYAGGYLTGEAVVGYRFNIW